MKKRIFIILCLFIFLKDILIARNNFPEGKTTLSGKITDKQTGELLPGVSIYIPELKTGAVSSADGMYKIENLPPSIVLVQVSMIGYKLIAEQIDLANVIIKDFALEESVAELNEVVVTGLSQAAEKNRTPTPITTIAPVQLTQITATNLVDAIATQPGISQVTTGAGISKPVIRGLGYNRVVVINDGIRQEGQQWGDEHGLEADEYSVNKVEILKGPASLAYGSDAMAGVIHLISAPTLPYGSIKGTILTNYQSNNGLIGISANLAGNQRGFIWDIRYSNKRAHAYKNKYDGYVFNSGFTENNVSGIAGINKSWGYSHLHFSVYNLTPGIIEGERDSATGKFTKWITKDDSTAQMVLAGNKDFKMYDPQTPFQKVHHYKMVLNNSFILGNGNLKAVLGWQQNQRKEYGDILYPEQYGLYFLLNTINYDLNYALPDRNNVAISFGTNGMYQISQNKGIEFLIPEYHLWDIGVFGMVKKTYRQLDISGGLRYDIRSEQGDALLLDSTGKPASYDNPALQIRFRKFNAAFKGISGSLGATYQFNEKAYTKLNLSGGFRAPNITELAANGVHEGTTNYIIGVPTLKAENSLQLDYAFGINSEHVTAEANVFYNHILNYIYLQRLPGNAGGDSVSEGYLTFQYKAGTANLYGGEISIDIHPHPFDWLHFENSFSYVSSVQANQPDSSKYLPLTPAPKFSSELRATSKNLAAYFRNAFIEIGMEHHLIQNHFFSAYDTETATPAYTLFNIGIGTDVVAKSRTLFSLFIQVNNLADQAYQAHLSRLKYTPVNRLTGRPGIYNMGRNISVKLIVPFEVRKK